MCTHTCVQTQHKAVHSGAVCSGRKRPDYKRRGPEPEPPWDGMPPLSETLRVCGRRAGSACVVMRKGKEQAVRAGCVPVRGDTCIPLLPRLSLGICRRDW